MHVNYLQSLLFLATLASPVASMCGTPHLNRAARSEPQIAGKFTRRALPTQADVDKLTPIVTDLYVHVVLSSKEQFDTIPRKVIDEQVKVLNDTYNKTKISFNFKDVDWTANKAWALAEGRVYEKMMKTLHKGGRSTLNLYVVEEPKNGGYPPNFSGPDGEDAVLGIAIPPEYMTSENLPIHNHAIVGAGTLPGGQNKDFNLGKTGTHEAGHWFGLMHTFDGGCSEPNDHVADTPASFNATSGCPIGRDSCPGMPGLDPIHNYMDYADDACSNEFSIGQIVMMHQKWNTIRNVKAKTGAAPKSFVGAGLAMVLGIMIAL